MSLVGRQQNIQLLLNWRPVGHVLNRITRWYCTVIYYVFTCICYNDTLHSYLEIAYLLELIGYRYCLIVEHDQTNYADSIHLWLIYQCNISELCEHSSLLLQPPHVLINNGQRVRDLHTGSAWLLMTGTMTGHVIESKAMGNNKLY